MLELRVTSGGRGDALVTPVSRFPFVIGRKDADYILVEPGVWDRHLVIDQGTNRRFMAIPQSEAPVLRAGVLINEPTPLRNGDVLELGSIQLQFRVSPTRQRSLAPLEVMVWIGLAILAITQVVLAFTW